MMQISGLLKCKGISDLFVPIIFAACAGLPAFVNAAEYKVSTTEVAYPIKDVAIKLMTRAYAKLGHNLTILEYPQGRALIESNAGRVDGELFRMAGINQEYKNLIQIPAPISFSQILAYVSEDSNLSPAKWSGLKGLRVGYVNGAKIVEIKLQGIPSIAVQNPEQLFYMLKNDRLDVAIYVATSAKLPDGVIALSTPLLKVPVYHYIHVKNKRLAAPLQDSIQRLTEQAELEGFNSSPIEGTFSNLDSGK